MTKRLREISATAAIRGYEPSVDVHRRQGEKNPPTKAEEASETDEAEGQNENVEHPPSPAATVKLSTAALAAGRFKPSGA